MIVYAIIIIIRSLKYWPELDLAVGSQIAIAKIIGGFKFWGSVRSHNTYTCIP